MNDAIFIANRSRLKRISVQLVEDLKKIQKEYWKMGIKISLVEASRILSKRFKLR